MAGLIREQVPLRRRHARPQPRLAALARPDRRLGRSPGSRRAAGTSRPPGSPIRAASTRSAGSSCRRSAHSSPSPPRSGGSTSARGHRPPSGRQARRAVVVRGAARAAPGARAQARPRRHARPVRDRPAARRRRAGDAACHRTCRGWTRPTGGGAVRRRLDDARPRGRDHGRPAASTDAAAVAAAAAALVGRGRCRRCPRRRPSRSTASASYARMRRGEAVAPPPRRVHDPPARRRARSTPATQRATIDVALLEGHLRPPDRRRPRRARPAPARTAPSCGAHGRAGSRWPTRARPTRIRADPTGRWYRSAADALPHLPARALDDAEQRDIAHGRALRRHGEDGVTRLLARRRAARGGEPARRAPAAGGGAVIVRQNLADVPDGEPGDRARAASTASISATAR